MEKFIALREKNLAKVSTNHSLGVKKVFLNELNSHASDLITQIAIAELKSGEIIESHSHNSMNEYFFILEGEGYFIINEEKIYVDPLMLISIPNKTIHSIAALTDIRFYYFGVQTILNS